jgi:hypothetical protein
MNISLKWLLLLLLFSQLLHSQYKVGGVIIDANTKETLAFANITINGNSTKGTISDIDGKFSYQDNTPISTIEVSYLGYKNYKIDVGDTNQMIIPLQSRSDNLDEVVVTTGENPALRIIRLVIANRDKNNPLKKGGFQYTSYNKSIVDQEDRFKKGDSLRAVYLQQIEKGELNLDSDSISSFDKTLIKEGNFNVMLLESVTERKFLPPDLSEEKVIGTRVSGFKNPYFAMLATELQPFGFYEDNIDLLDLHFLNPIANGSMKRYDYFLEEEIIRDQDTIFNISYQPKKTANIDGLKGFMYINSNGYAIQNIIAQPFDKMMIQLKIQQKYQLLKEENWFPEQLNFELVLNEGVFINGKTYLRDIKFLPDLKRRFFSEVQLKYEKDAPKKPKSFWQKYRVDSLTPVEKTTYKVVDSLGKELNLDKVLDIANKLGDGYIPWGKFNIPFDKFFNFNRYEGFRLGAGLYTNEKLFEKVSFGGYAAYGFRDKDWKYGGEIRYDINRSKDMYLKFNYQNDVREIGTAAMSRNSGFSLNGDLRSFIASNMDFVESFQMEFGRRDFKYLKWNASVRQEQIDPKYNYFLIQNQSLITGYQNTEAVINLRYALRERIVETPLKRVSLGTDYPVSNVRYARGFDSFLNGDFNYNKLEASVHQSIFTRNLGKTRYRLQAGIIDGDLPLGLLFTGEGSNYRDIPVVMYDTFQTMLPYEFLSDRYVHLFLTHDIGSLLFKTETFSPGLILHHNMGWGDLSHPFSHAWNYQTKENIFMESGIEFTKLIKINYLDTLYFNFGIGGFFRHGDYSFEKTSDNFVFKINTTFSFN